MQSGRSVVWLRSNPSMKRFMGDPARSVGIIPCFAQPTAFSHRLQSLRTSADDAQRAKACKRSSSSSTAVNVLFAGTSAPNEKQQNTQYFAPAGRVGNVAAFSEVLEPVR